MFPVQDTGANELRIQPDPDPTCTGYQYILVTDSAVSGSYLYRIRYRYKLITYTARAGFYMYKIPVQINYRFGRIISYLYRIPVRTNY